MAGNEVRVVITAEDRASGTIDKVGKSMRGNLTKGAIAAGVAVGALGVKATLMAASFETAFAEVTTLIDVPEEVVQKLDKDIRQMSRTMGVDAVEATQALYQAISAGQAPSQAVAFLAETVKLAVGGVTDLTTAVDLNTTILNAWGLQSSELGRVQDALFTTVRLGKTTIDELGAAMFNVAPTAAAASIGIEEIGAALATLTASGIRTSEATTKLRELINALVAPSVRASKMQKELGLSFDQNTIAADGLVPALQEIMDVTGGNLEVMRKLLGSQEALQAALVLGGQSSEFYGDALIAMSDNVGSTDLAFLKMNATFERQVQILKAELSGTMIDVGRVILPHVTKAVEALTDAMRTKLPAAIDRVRVAWAEWGPLVSHIVGLLVQVGGEFARMVTVIGNNKEALAAIIVALGVVFVVTFGPIGVIVVAVAAAIAAVGLLSVDIDKASVPVLELRGNIIKLGLSFLKLAESTGHGIGELLDFTGNLTDLDKWIANGINSITGITGKMDEWTDALADNENSLRRARQETAKIVIDINVLADQLDDASQSTFAFTRENIKGDFSMQRAAASAHFEAQMMGVLGEAGIAAANALGLSANQMLTLSAIAVATGQNVAILAKKLAVAAAAATNFGPDFNIVQLQAQVAAASNLIDAFISSVAAGPAIVVPVVPSTESILPPDLGSDLAGAVEELEEEVSTAWADAAAAWMEAVRTAILAGSLVIADALGILETLGVHAFRSVLGVFAEIEKQTESLASIIERAITRGAVTVQDVLDLIDLGPIGEEAAEDFMDALAGKSSDIAAAIFKEINDTAIEEAFEAADAFVKAFEQGAQDLASIISGIGSSLGAIMSQLTVEDAQARARILLKQLEIMELQEAAAADAEARAARVLQMEQDLAAWREGAADAILKREEAINAERSRIQDLRDTVADMRDDAEKAAALLAGEFLPGNRGLTDIANDILKAREALEEGAQGRRAQAIAAMELAELETEFDDLAAGIDEQIKKLEEEITVGEEKLKLEEAALEHFKGIIDAHIKLLEEQIEAEKGLGSAAEAAIAALEAEIAIINEQVQHRAILNELLLIEAQLRNDLLPTNASLNDELAKQIDLLHDLEEVFANLAAGIFNSTDVFTLFNAGLFELGQMLLLLIAGVLDPGILPVFGGAQATAPQAAGVQSLVDRVGAGDSAPFDAAGIAPFEKVTRVENHYHIAYLEVTGGQLEALGTLGVLLRT